MVITLLLCGCSRDNELIDKPIDSAHFVLVAETRTSERSEQEVDEFWQKGPSVRLERGDGEVFIQAEQREYKFKRKASTGLSLSLQAKEYKPMDPIGNARKSAAEIMDNSDKKKITTERVNGDICRRFECERSGELLGGKIESILWISISNQFPIKIIHQGSDFTQTLVYSNVEINIDLDGGLFAPPSNVSFR